MYRDSVCECIRDLRAVDCIREKKLRGFFMRSNCHNNKQNVVMGDDEQITYVKPKKY